MTSCPSSPTNINSDKPADCQSLFLLQQAAHRNQLNPTLEQRRDDLRTLHRMLVENSEALVEAVNQDYGCRSKFETRMTEMLTCQDGILDAINALKKWMKPRKRHLDMGQFPLAKAWTFPQPVGVVGIVVPWNFPIAMAIAPLTGAFAAGNRSMIRMSLNSSHLARLFKEISPKYFPLDKLAFFTADDCGGNTFTSLPFDHIFFTGSPETGKLVMANAAANLTPVTLELGGKSPCVVAPDYPIRKAVERILWAKMLNAGQICTTVDYLFLPEGKVDEFIREARTVLNQRVPNINNGDYSAIIDQSSYLRLQGVLADALNKGAKVIDLYSGPQPDAERRIMPTCLVLNINDDMHIMQREIFGPLLPILTYKTREEVVQYVGDHPRPLAFYLYSDDRALRDYYLHNTISGGVGINEAVAHVGVHDLPFGGTGNSGMGHYHGYEGFLTFSKLRPVFQQGPIRGIDMLQPPYAGWPNRILNLMLRLKS
ncbi:coniferyl-aldehyde dehydrogenase [Pseudomonas alcaligenes]|uniref:Aldehyde dehydrogenase n=1 Tax=Aquipseudomonas alcaligenes TaxID=43263 RepID=A0ABR7S1X9_AQUAC|nr:coniferyl aldehyde dehydrogenase [Pseudomonas alcaligenes]MBC9250964.1 coniferyl-aldehyde dehydrogenase [Pseudomonas alcaligenes]